LNAALGRYWITSSAVANSVSGMVRPRALAVLRLMTRAYLVGELHWHFAYLRVNVGGIVAWAGQKVGARDHGVSATALARQGLSDGADAVQV
jgi:hypothetical protein